MIGSTAGEWAGRLAFVAAEIGDRLEVRREFAEQPHQLGVAPRSAFKRAGRLNLVKVAIEIGPRHGSRMIAGPPGPGACTRSKPRPEIKCPKSRLLRVFTQRRWLVGIRVCGL
jgi:hypothetical protein